MGNKLYRPTATVKQVEAPAFCPVKTFRICIKVCQKCAEEFRAKDLAPLVPDDNGNAIVEKDDDGRQRRRYILALCDDCIEQKNRLCRIIEEPPYA